MSPSIPEHPAWPTISGRTYLAQFPASTHRHGRDAIPPDEWIRRCATRLRQKVQDEGVDDAALYALAIYMIEERPYRDMDPEAAAERQQHDEA